MADIFDIDYKIQAPEILPVDKRTSNTIALMQSLLNGLQWARDFFFGSYKTGSTASTYATGTYNEFQQVIFNKSVYYSLNNGNTALPTDTTQWVKIQDNFLGVDQRVKFNGQRLVLEYALNLQFGGVFRPPGSSSPSDIYLTNLPAIISGFISAKTEAYSSSIGQTTSVDKIGLAYPFTHINNFQINIKVALYAATNDKAIRNFVNLYIPISLNYTIVTY